MPQNRSPQQGDDVPVTSVSWTEAQEFCQKLSLKEGGPYRLPTEAEWEYACRAGGGAVEADLAGVAWYADNSGEATHAAGGKKANAWGLHDLLGNVAEWTQDAYGPYPRVAEEMDPKGPGTGKARVVRGGSWRSFAPLPDGASPTSSPDVAARGPHG
jgi:formylglycine-generating enzyme required for sulfatase activity